SMGCCLGIALLLPLQARCPTRGAERLLSRLPGFTALSRPRDLLYSRHSARPGGPPRCSNNKTWPIAIHNEPCFLPARDAESGTPTAIRPLAQVSSRIES